MIIKNKKTGKFESITHETWDKMKELDLRKKFEILDNTDPSIETMEVNIPQEVKDFMSKLHDMKITPIEPEPEVPETSEVSIPEDESEGEAHDDMGTKRRGRKPKIVNHE